MNPHDPLALSALSDSGLPITLVLKSGPATLAGDTLVVTNAGPVLVTARQTGDATHAPAEQDLLLNAPHFDAREIGVWPPHVRGSALSVDADGPGDLQVFDAAEPANPSLLASLDYATPTDTADAVDVDGRFAYLVNRQSGLHVIDLARPEQPVELGRVTIGNPVYDLTVVGTHAFVAAGSAGLVVVDVQDPALPRIVARHPTGCIARDVAVDNGLALIANGPRGSSCSTSATRPDRSASPTSVAPTREPDPPW